MFPQRSDLSTRSISKHFHQWNALKGSLPADLNTMSGERGALATLLSFLVVGALWGCTNPFIKRGSAGSLVYRRRDNSLGQFVAQAVSIVKNWQFVLPFALNQSGSVVYVYLLGSSEISHAVPICNSLTFVFTALTSRLLGEKPRRPLSTYLGMVVILLGVAVCFDSKRISP